VGSSRLAVLSLIVAIAAPACTGVSRAPDEGPPIDWERPFHETGPTFATPVEANAVLPFKVVVPSLPGPNLIQTLPPASVPKDEQVVALVYHFPGAGTVVIQESLPGDKDLGWLRETVAAHADEPVDDPAAPQAFRIVDIRKTEGMLIQGNGVGRIVWIEDGLLFDITGPTVTPEQVLAIAERV
jgi:hypothetical protein